MEDSGFPRTPIPNISSDTIAGVAESAFNQGQTLAKVPIFSGLTESELSFLAQRAVPRHYSAGESVFGEGEPCSGLYVVESGHVRIFKSSANGREQVLSIDGPGSSIAELPVFDGGNYPASVTAIDDATLLFVSKQDFQALVPGPSSGGAEGLAGGRCALAPTGRDHRRTLIHHSASPAGFVSVTSRPEGRQTFRRRRGNHAASQQSGIGIADWHGPRARFPQPLPAAGRGNAHRSTAAT